MEWWRILYRIAGFAFAIFLVAFGNRWLGVVLLALFLLTTVIGRHVRRNPGANIAGLHPHLFTGIMLMGGGIYMVVITVLLYERDRSEPAPLFWPILSGLGAVLWLALGTEMIRHWRTHR